MLEPLAQRALRQSLIISDVGLGIFFMRPISAVLTVAALVAVGVPVLRAILGAARRAGRRADFTSNLPGTRPSCARAHRATNRSACMRIDIRVKQAPNHPLILCITSRSRSLEELDALLAECDRDLDVFVPERQLLRGRKKVLNDLWIPHRFIRVLDFPAHR